MEVTIAALTGDDDSLVGEAADLIFHLRVVLRARKIPFVRVIEELARRHRDRAPRP